MVLGTQSYCRRTASGKKIEGHAPVHSVACINGLRPLQFQGDRCENPVKIRQRAARRYLKQQPRMPAACGIINSRSTRSERTQRTGEGDGEGHPRLLSGLDAEKRRIRRRWTFNCRITRDHLSAVRKSRAPRIPAWCARKTRTASPRSELAGGADDAMGGIQTPRGRSGIAVELIKTEMQRPDAKAAPEPFKDKARNRSSFSTRSQATPRSSCVAEPAADSGMAPTLVVALWQDIKFQSGTLGSRLYRLRTTPGTGYARHRHAGGRSIAADNKEKPGIRSTRTVTRAVGIDRGGNGSHRIRTGGRL